MKLTNKTEATHITSEYSDIFVVNAARVSFSKESSFDENGNIRESDQKLINYLASHHHWTTFSHIRDTFLFNDIDIDWLLTSLVPDNYAGMVINKVMYGDKHYWAIRHSLYGWIKLLALNLTDYIFQNEQAAFIYKKLLELYPSSMTAFSKTYDFLKYANTDITNTDTHHVKSMLEKNENNDYVYKLFNTNMIKHFVDITIREYVPIFVARQRFKHMVAFTFNESSRRYVDFEPEYFSPDILRGRAKNKKQGSTDTYCENHNLAYELYLNSIESANDAYLKLVNDNGEFKTCPEQARGILPQAMMTDYYATGSYAAWKRLEYWRIDEHSQLEIQDHAKKINEITKLYDESINDYVQYCTISISFE